VAQVGPNHEALGTPSKPGALEAPQQEMRRPISYWGFVEDSGKARPAVLPLQKSFALITHSAQPQSRTAYERRM
jgi:hypothetical protein